MAVGARLEISLALYEVQEIQVNASEYKWFSLTGKLNSTMNAEL